MKKTNFKKSMIALVVGGFLAQAAHAETKTLTGVVVDDEGKPIANAEVYLRTQNKKVITNEAGQFNFDGLEEGRYVIDVEAARHGHINKSVRHNGSKITLIVEDDAETIVVTGNPLEHSSLEMASPSVIISGDRLVKNRGANIGETLAEVPGINLSSFGTGAGHPVIRGQQGNRVTVLSNNSSTQDVSNSSPDHWIAAEPLLAKRVEVLKGPATLLYGGGAVGGAVNVVDNKIPTEAPDGIDGGFEVRLGDSATGERSFVGTLTKGIQFDTGTLALHLDGFSSKTDSFEIPGYAESWRLREAEEHEEHEEHEGEEHEEHEEVFGLLENSDTDTQGGNIGFSWITDSGYWGVSYSHFDRNYGLPGHSHHHEEEHGEHEEEHEGEEHEEHEEEFARLDLVQKRFDIKGEWNDPFTGFQDLKFSFSNSNYEHTEIEGEENGTTFKNDASELRLELVHNSWSGWQGAFGFHYTDSDFSAIGEEAFIPASNTTNVGLFWLEETNVGDWHHEFGIRFDAQQVNVGTFGSRSDSAVSFAAGTVWHINENWSLPINFARAQRAPQVEELLSNAGNDEDHYVPHLATQSIEVGDINLRKETAKNFDIGLRFHTEDIHASIAIFHNRIDDFIYQEFVDEDHLEEEGHHEEEHHHEFPIYQYAQQDAIFEGVELEIDWAFAQTNYGYWKAGIFGDYTHAEFDNSTGAYIPRQPAKRFGASLGFEYGDFSADLKAIKVAKQDKVSRNEFVTDGYDLLNLTIGYGVYFDNADGLLFLKATNLLDEEIRDHSSYLKDRAPRAGRSISAGFRLTF